MALIGHALACHSLGIHQNKDRLSLCILASGWVPMRMLAWYSQQLNVCACRIRTPWLHGCACACACVGTATMSRHGRIEHDNQGDAFGRRVFLQDRRGQDVDHKWDGGRRFHRRRFPRVRQNRPGSAGHQHVSRREGEYQHRALPSSVFFLRSFNRMEKRTKGGLVFTTFGLFWYTTQLSSSSSPCVNFSPSIGRKYGQEVTIVLCMCGA